MKVILSGRIMIVPGEKKQDERDGLEEGTYEP